MRRVAPRPTLPMPRRKGATVTGVPMARGHLYLPRPAAWAPGRRSGAGPAAKAGDKVSVQYVGVSYTNGRQFDASWDRGQPFDFTLGNGDVIQGWDQGVAGMKVGGRRRITIPPDLAYGKRGAGGVIGPDETLVFVVDLVAVS